jgi:hypothetical protein
MTGHNGDTSTRLNVFRPQSALLHFNDCLTLHIGYAEMRRLRATTRMLIVNTADYF